MATAVEENLPAPPEPLSAREVLEMGAPASTEHLEVRNVGELKPARNGGFTMDFTNRNGDETREKAWKCVHFISTLNEFFMNKSWTKKQS